MIKTLVLAGGLGTRLREETEYTPKPMVNIGGRPIIWHIMKNLSQQGVKDFTIATGYKEEVIKDYFLNYHSRSNNFTVNLGQPEEIDFHDSHEESDWNVTILSTGEKTSTGGRVYKSRPYLDDQRFLCTYGDGLCDINMHELIAFHKSHGLIATVTTVMPLSRFGMLEVSDSGIVTRFEEKPKHTSWINGGFFIFEPKVFEYLNDSCTLEQDPLAALVADRQLAAYRHHGFWQPMDTYREYSLLNSLWDENLAPWKNW